MSIDKCLFCDLQKTKKDQNVLENDLFYAHWDENPVNKGHALIISKRHTLSFFDLTELELTQMYNLLQKTKAIIDEKYNPDAYNIGVNDGGSAGRTIHHLHIHLIPRYKGDVENPRGGVRHIIPGKGDY